MAAVAKIVSPVKMIAGGLLFLAGAAGMAVTIAAAYVHNQACERLSFALGLPGSLVLSSLAQCGLFLGAAMLWSAWRHTD